jgi:hypothetical protein
MNRWRDKAALGVLLLAITAGCNQDKIARLVRENRELAAKLDAVSKTTTLELQEKCANQARAVFREMGWDKKPFALYTNHYNRKLNKCFIRIESREFTRNVPSIAVSISDAFEGKGYAEYFWNNTQGKKYWDVKPFICNVTQLSGEERPCTSQEEFDDFVRLYMEQ